MADTSILTSTKKVLGLAEDYTHFDPDIILHINSVFGTLSQLGIGPDDGFMIEDSTAMWGDFLGERKKLNAVKTYMYLKVRAYFDPPQTGYAVTAMAEQIKELEWRLNVERESYAWVDPNPVTLPDNPLGDPAILDGGTGY